MLDFKQIFIDGGLTSFLFVLLMLAVALTKPRLFLNKGDLPADILAAVPPKTEAEKRQSIWLSLLLFPVMLGIPIYSAYSFAVQNPGAGFWPIFWHLFLVGLIVNLADLVLLDWLVLNTITPRFFVYPGTEGLAGYKDKAFHLRQHAKAFPFLTAFIALSAGAIYWLV